MSLDDALSSSNRDRGWADLRATQRRIRWLLGRGEGVVNQERGGGGRAHPDLYLDESQGSLAPTELARMESPEGCKQEIWSPAREP